MKKKNRPGKATVSKIPLKPSSIVARALNVMANLNNMQGGKGHLCEGIDALDRFTLSKTFGRSKNDVEEADQGKEPLRNVVFTEAGDDKEPSIEGWEDDSIPSIVPETPNSSDNDKAASARKEKFSFNSPSTSNWDSLAMSDWTEEGLCIKCNKGDQVMACSFNGCWIGVHSWCLAGSASFDDNGNFYCPLCSYKRAMSELHEVEKEEALAKEKARLARKYFSLFIGGYNKKESSDRSHKKELDQSRKSVDRSCPPGTTNESRKQRGRDTSNSTGLGKCQQEAAATTGCTTDGKLGKDTSLASDRNGTPLSGEASHAKLLGSDQHKSVDDRQEAVAAATTDGNLGVETSLVSEKNDASHSGRHAEAIDDYQCESLVEHQSQVETNVSCASDNVSRGEYSNLPTERCGPLTQRKEIETEMSEEHQHPREGEQPMQAEAMEIENRKSPCRETEAVAVDAEHTTQKTLLQPKAVDPVERSSSESSLDEKKAAPSKSMKSYKSLKRSSNPVLPNARRKKLPWTVEEEDMLKEAVKKFSSKANKNMPWKSILEYGSNVFNGSRTPVDLKDKWRNMSKEGSRARQR